MVHDLDKTYHLPIQLCKTYYVCPSAEAKFLKASIFLTIWRSFLTLKTWFFERGWPYPHSHMTTAPSNLPSHTPILHGLGIKYFCSRIHFPAITEVFLSHHDLGNFPISCKGDDVVVTQPINYCGSLEFHQTCVLSQVSSKLHQATFLDLIPILQNDHRGDSFVLIYPF